MLRKLRDYYIENSCDDNVWYRCLLDNDLAVDLTFLETYDVNSFASNVMSEVRLRDDCGEGCGGYQGDGGGELISC